MLFRSNKPIINIAIAIQPNPARNPAIAPQLAVVLLSFKNIARLIDMTRDQRSESPKIFAVPFFRFASSSLFSRAQIPPKSNGEYQSPPKRKVLNAATITASQLIVEIFIQKKFPKVTQEVNIRIGKN